MDMSEINKLLEQQGKDWHEFKSKNDQRIEALEKGNKARADELDAELKKINDSMANFEELKGALQTVEKKMHAALQEAIGDTEGRDLKHAHSQFNLYRKSYLGSQHKDVSIEEYTNYRKAFDSALRKGTLTPDELKAMQAGTDTDGGYFLPAPTVGRTVKRIYERSPFRQIVSVMQISTEAVEGIEDLDEAATGGWVGETQARNETATPQIGKWRIAAHEIYAQPKITQKLLDDAAVDVEGWLADKVADKIGRVEDLAFLTGDGVAKPRGLLDYPTAATNDGSRLWGVFEHIETGASGAFGTNADKLFDLISLFKTYYLQRARWLTNRAVILAVRKLKESTTNAYMWQPGLQQGQPDRLLGYPISISQDMPAIAGGSLSLAFGDFAEAYLIVDRIGLRTLRDPYTEKPFIKFYTTRRVGGGALNFEAVKFLKTTA